MIDFQPFHAWRYHPHKVNLPAVIAPPYDVISPAAQKKLYGQSPYNCVRLILNQEQNSDDLTSNRYTRARDFFSQWRHEGILVREQEPCFYLYRQVFTDPSSGEKKHRLALLGRLRLEPFEKGLVIAHEKTLSKPREDRRKLLEATATNFSPVFGLYEDSKEEFLSLYSEAMAFSPLFDLSDEDQIRHTVWAIHDSELIERIHQGLAAKKIYIADGHHRYQTALEYARDKRQREGISPEREMPFDYVLMALVEFRDPGLVLLPTHRILTSWPGFDPVKALESLKYYFKVESCSPESLKEKLQKASLQDIVFGLILGQEQFFLTLVDLEKAKQKMPAGKADRWYQLDVSVLSYLVLASLWNLPEALWESVLHYTHSEEEAIAHVRSQSAAAAFLLKAPPVEILREMGKASELMPQKSTYFYPKLASGLVFYHHENEV